ncbi:triose-phosphate isomerase [Acetobacteraceae bacterium ESL0709]|nr:triose-phosphate isomerase [Acetobacteraceae bacterium ESL0697]MDF7677918.1 triose-phosphate isomerase [Acetobacteraceae bacterium ESL0709]
MGTLPKFVIGNWKMLSEHAHALKLASEVAAYCAEHDHPHVKTVICPTFTQLVSVEEILKDKKLAPRKLALGAQDCYPAPGGAFTGDISAPMLAEIGVRYVIVGHSERRQKHNETSKFVCEKTVAARDSKLTPVVCIGETLSERQDGQTAHVLGEQIARSLPENFEGIVAYEPIWAIGTGVTPTMEGLQDDITTIRKLLERHQPKTAERIPLLYGGSVKPDQSAEIFAIKGVNGVLVGGASLKAQDFVKIIQSAPQG